MPGFLSDEQVAVLRTAHKTTRENDWPIESKQWSCCIMDSLYEQIAQALFLDEVTLRRYVQQFQEQGIDGLLSAATPEACHP